MRRLLNGLALACSLGLAACVAPSHGTRPQAVQGEADTYRFRIFPYALVLNETFADRAVEEEIAKFRSANRYASSAVLARDQRDGGFVYTVRFAR
jgi:hypothetical protein